MNKELKDLVLSIVEESSSTNLVDSVDVDAHVLSSNLRLKEAATAIKELKKLLEAVSSEDAQAYILGTLEDSSKELQEMVYAVGILGEMFGEVFKGSL